MPPIWLQITAIVALILAFLCMGIILVDLLLGHPQKMWIMNIVWPVTALYFGPVAIWAYYRMGRPQAKGQKHMSHGMIIGFTTSYPMNWWLLKEGIKETM
jgi:hypothetical protein